MSTPPTKFVPRATPETQPYWDGTAAGELRIQQCVPEQHTYFYPRTSCPVCGTEEVKWVTASGRAQLHTYVISHRPAPGFTPPYVIAVVELEEGPRMMTNLVGIEPDPALLELDMDLVVDFEARGEDVSVPVFRPADSEAAA